MSLWLSSLDDFSVAPPASVSAWLETHTSITEKAKISCHQVRLQLLGEGWKEENPPCAPLCKGGNPSLLLSGEQKIEPLACESGETVAGNKVFVREILMFCDEKPAWYAQTQIPEKTYERRAEQFKNLQGRPIGSILFIDPNITREDTFYAYLTASTAEYKQAIQYYHPNSAILSSDSHASGSTFHLSLSDNEGFPPLQRGVQGGFSVKTMPQGLWARKSIFHIDGEPLYLMEIFFPDMFVREHR